MANVRYTSFENFCRDLKAYQITSTRFLDMEESYCEDTARSVFFFRFYEDFLQQFGKELFSAKLNTGNPFTVKPGNRSMVQANPLWLAITKDTLMKLFNDGTYQHKQQLTLGNPEQRFSILCGGLCWMDWHCFFYGVRCVFAHGDPTETMGPRGCLPLDIRVKIRQGLKTIVDNCGNFPLIESNLQDLSWFIERIPLLGYALHWKAATSKLKKYKSFIAFGKILKYTGGTLACVSGFLECHRRVNCNFRLAQTATLIIGGLGITALITGLYLVNTFQKYFENREGLQQWRWANDMLSLLDLTERTLRTRGPNLMSDQNAAAPDGKSISYAVKLWMPQMLKALATTFMNKIKIEHMRLKSAGQVP